MMRFRRLWSASGVALLEIAVALSVLAMAAALVVPVATQQLQLDRDAQTRQQLFEVYRGLLGDPALDSYGFVGDVGDLPDALNDLITKPGALPTYTTSTTGGVGVGWRGPYVDRGIFPGDEFRDAWGQTLEYGGKTGVGGGRTGRGQTRSAGPDGALGTSDDIVFPLTPVVTDGTLTVTVHVVEKGKEPPVQQFVPNPVNSEVVAYKTVNGAQVVQETQATPMFSQQSQARRGFSFVVHHGPHALRVRHYKDDNKKANEMVQGFLVAAVRAQSQGLAEASLITPHGNVKTF